MNVGPPPSSDLPFPSCLPAAPPPFPYGVSPQGAECLCAEWMLHLGAADVVVTPFSQDGGIDITSRLHVAQVKHWAGAVGAPTVREIAGVAAVETRAGIVFASGAFTDEAVRFADAAGVLLFAFSPENATLTGVSREARRALDEGLDDAKTVQAERLEHWRRVRSGESSRGPQMDRNHAHNEGQVHRRGTAGGC